MKKKENQNSYTSMDEDPLRRPRKDSDISEDQDEQHIDPPENQGGRDYYPDSPDDSPDSQVGGA